MKTLFLVYIVIGSIVLGLGTRNPLLGLSAFIFGVALLCLKVDTQ